MQANSKFDTKSLARGAVGRVSDALTRQGGFCII